MHILYKKWQEQNYIYSNLKISINKYYNRVYSVVAKAACLSWTKMTEIKI